MSYKYYVREDQLVQVWSGAEKIATIMIFRNNLFSVHLFPPVVVSTVSRAEKKQK